MRPVFPDDVARELGYQKYEPELHDWILATLGCLAVCAIFVGFVLLVHFYL